mmetsp:Transcript_31210/g.70244  ORF Transcript_31210/g.70244 Transcript_31210/m.70244 type:complete len:229 (+) Transcript_31210:433-1119(+)
MQKVPNQSSSNFRDYEQFSCCFPSSLPSLNAGYHEDFQQQTFSHVLLSNYPPASSIAPLHASGECTYLHQSSAKPSYYEVLGGGRGEVPAAVQGDGVALPGVGPGQLQGGARRRETNAASMTPSSRSSSSSPHTRHYTFNVCCWVDGLTDVRTVQMLFTQPFAGNFDFDFGKELLQKLNSLWMSGKKKLDKLFYIDEEGDQVAILTDHELWVATLHFNANEPVKLLAN